jgi:uncharacterized radical SAM protein YgiQ
MYLPTTRKELDDLGWERPDVILVTGDTYIDSPHVGVAVVGQWLLKHGFRTAILAQPSVAGEDLARLGEPALFWGVTGGCIDSMVANYTPLKKRRNQDDYTPGGINVRPDRASIAYARLIRQRFGASKPVVLGGLEASLRRVAHYDYWDNTVRRSILIDARADLLAYGMAEQTVVELARALKEGTDWRSLKGICHILREAPEGFVALPSYGEVLGDRAAFRRMSALFFENLEPGSPGLVQKHGDRLVVQNPPRPPLTTEELDAVHEMDFERDVHPHYRTGEVRALDTIGQSVTTHRGCFGQCSFCSISAHQGRQVVSRSAESVVREVERLRDRPGFNGIVADLGGPTANMYGAGCARGGTCRERRCLMPRVCPDLRFGHAAQMDLLERVRNLPGIDRVFVSSGIRHDLVVADREHGPRYVDQLVRHHISGRIRLAPEHSEAGVLALMGKPSPDALVKFKAMFDRSCREQGQRCFATYYIMAAHPGCRMEDMDRLRQFLAGELRNHPEQVQIFTPTPSSVSTALYHCETDLAGRPLFVEKDPGRKQMQKDRVKKRDGDRPAATGRPSAAPAPSSGSPRSSTSRTRPSAPSGAARRKRPSAPSAPRG